MKMIVGDSTNNQGRVKAFFLPLSLPVGISTIGCGQETKLCGCDSAKKKKCRFNTTLTSSKSGFIIIFLNCYCLKLLCGASCDNGNYIWELCIFYNYSYPVQWQATNRGKKKPLYNRWGDQLVEHLLRDTCFGGVSGAEVCTITNALMQMGQC